MPTVPLNKPQLNETANNHTFFQSNWREKAANQQPFRIYYNKKYHSKSLNENKLKEMSGHEHKDKT